MGSVAYDMAVPTAQYLERAPLLTVYARK